MKKVLGDEWPFFTNAFHQQAPVSIRLNSHKCIHPPSETKIPWAQNGYYLPVRPAFTFDPFFHAGAYYVQEASSMFIEQAILQCADLTTSINILDLCAAPGGKSTHLLSLINQQSLLVSNEVIRSRAMILAENIQKWGYDNVVVTNNDPENFQRVEGFFDVIIIDAPCSGEGLFRRDHEAMKEWSSENVALCYKRQRRILRDVWPALKQGGLLIYSTCTYNENENEENLHWLKSECDVDFLEIKTEKHWGIAEVRQQEILGYRFYPHKVMGEGFFLSAIRKKDPAKEIRIRNNKNSFGPPGKKILEQLNEWVINPTDKDWILRNDVIQFMPSNKKSEIELIASNFRVVTAGTLAASVKHDKLIPQHPLSLSIHLNKRNFTPLAVDKREAIQYLRKETISIPSNSTGFALVTFEHLTLGWVNILPNRINNLYPPEWRIKMANPST